MMTLREEVLPLCSSEMPLKRRQSYPVAPSATLHWIARVVSVAVLSEMPEGVAGASSSAGLSGLQLQPKNRHAAIIAAGIMVFLIIIFRIRAQPR